MGFQHPHPNTFGYIVPLEKGRRGFLIIANTDEEFLTSTSYLTKLKSGSEGCGVLYKCSMLCGITGFL